MMHKHWLVLLLMLISLCKCSGPAEEAEPAETIVDLKPTDSVGFSAFFSPLEVPISDAVTGWVLDTDSALGIRLMGENILLFSGYGGTKLTLFSGEDLTVSAETILPCTIYPDDPTVKVDAQGITYLDRRNGEFVCLDPTLEIQNRITLPDNAEIGVLSEDRNFFYYCTADALQVLDLQTSLVRLIKEMNYPWQEVYALYCNDTVIQCTTILDDLPHSLFLSAETGKLRYECAGAVDLWTLDDLYFTTRMDGTYQELISGSQHFGSSILVPRAEYLHVEPILPQKSVLLYTRGDQALILDRYHLETGIREFQTTLPSAYYPVSMQSDPNSNKLWFLTFDAQRQSDLLCVWEVESSPTDDSVSYLQDHWSPQNPNLEGLTQCTDRAAELSMKHQVQIVLWEDAAACHPEGYTLIPEHQVPLILRQLEELDQALSRYPVGFLSDLTAPTGRFLKICLVREIIGDASGDTLNSAAGLQFWDADSVPNIVITSGADAAQNIHHEIFHVIDSRVLSSCNAYDNWSSLNPPDFSYDYGYAVNLKQDGWEWVIGDNPYFIDLYAMSFPREDRARIMEYAMMEDQAAVFEAPAMQAKLRQICLGIREAFQLKNAPIIYPWEQHLTVPLTPQT